MSCCGGLVIIAVSPHRYTDSVSQRNPPAVPADTSAEAWLIQMNAIASQTVEQRLETWAELNAQFAHMEEDAVRRQHPNFSDHDVLVELVRRRYGDDLAKKVWPIDGNQAS